MITVRGLDLSEQHLHLLMLSEQGVDHVLLGCSHVRCSVHLDRERS
jgi:hypothetical protein